MNPSNKKDSHIQDWVSAHDTTKGKKKFDNYLKWLFDSPEFLNIVKKIRINLKIPVNGFKKNDEEKLKLSESDKKAIDKAINFLESKAAFGLEVREAVTEFIFYNSYELIFSNYSTNSLCVVGDLISEYNDPYSDAFAEEMRMHYPVAIKISPYASKRDILDYVSKIYKFEISAYQEKYKKEDIKLSKIKTRKSSITTRNKFIFENRDKSRREIAKLLGEKFGPEHVLDVGHIGKIISEEKKRRKEI